MKVLVGSGKVNTIIGLSDGRKKSGPELIDNLDRDLRMSLEAL